MIMVSTPSTPSIGRGHPEMQLRETATDLDPLVPQLFRDSLRVRVICEQLFPPLSLVEAQHVVVEDAGASYSCSTISGTPHRRGLNEHLRYSGDDVHPASWRAGSSAFSAP